MNRISTLLAGALVLCTASAQAAPPETVAAMFSAKTVSERDAALSSLASAASGDGEAAFAAGAGQFLTALEILATGLHRHGFESPRSFMLPLMRLPVPPNENPEPLTYEEFRAILVAFRDRLQQSAATLALVPAGADIGIVADLAHIGIDLDEDGAIGDGESVTAILAAISGSPEQAPPGALAFRFDRADGYWLQGYAEFLTAQADFWLAHDFRQAFDGSFHMLFPRAKLPMQEALVPAGEGASGGILSSEWRIADFVSFIHMVNWPVVEPDRRRGARAHLLEMIRLSRENWKAIRAETDNDREWLPGPHQKGANPLTGLEVAEEQVQGWHEALAMAEDLLEGRALLPHFRIPDKGIDMKRFFDEPQTFDLVLSITGPAIVPYLASGKVLTAEEFGRIERQFGGGGFLSFALWFN